MKFRNFLRIAFVGSTFLMLNGCVEPIDIKNESFESALVIEATITNELKPQEILLSRTFQLEEEGPSPESNAKVSIVDDQMNEYIFQETTPGSYTSIEPFQTESGRTYKLEITTSDGRKYASDPVVSPAPSVIENLYAERTTFRGEDGMALMIDVPGAPNTTGYYRYNFEETYKIISPFQYPLDLVYEDGIFIEIKKTKEERVCYNTDNSQDIILANTSSEEGKNLKKFLVRFINSRNPILSQRYTILVNQYMISEEAFAYYETLKKFSGSDNLFSQNQPGFINGNVFSVDNPAEKVVGFFGVSATDSKRIFFNHEDFYDDSEFTDGFVDCFIARPSASWPPLREALGEKLNRGDVKYLGETMVPGDPGEGPYRVVKAACVDCTLLGTSEVPEFWEE